ncbi:MAG: hypothetical protein IKL27_01180 [Oscillospiraceae bacterium]|nr:hypothetical protein [Oscillospiraceae bacterium]
MKKHIISILCLILGLVIGVGGYLIYDLATSVPDRELGAEITGPAAGASNQELVEQSYNVLSYIQKLDYNSLSKLVHPEYGIYFSPYSNINLTSNQWFSSDMLAMIDKVENPFVWGVYDGSGEPISMSADEYFSRFVYDRNFAGAPIVTIDRIAKSGNSLENTVELFPGCRFVDFYIPAQNEDALDWSLLRLIYEEHNGSLYLVAIVHNEYTV